MVVAWVGLGWVGLWLQVPQGLLGQRARLGSAVDPRRDAGARRNLEEALFAHTIPCSLVRASLASLSALSCDVADELHGRAPALGGQTHHQHGQDRQPVRPGTADRLPSLAFPLSHVSVSNRLI